MDATPIGRHSLTDPTPVGHQTNPVSRVQRNLRQAQSGVGGIVQLAQLPDAGPHQASGVDHDPNGLTAFDLIDPSHQLSPAGRRGPANVAILIPFPIFTQTLKFPADPPHGRVTLLEFDLPAAH